MSNERMAFELFKFLQKDVTAEKLHESTKKAFEGKLPQDSSEVKEPEKEIRMLAEKSKDKIKKDDVATNPKIKTDNAGVTEQPEKPKVITDLEKQSPDVDKLTQDKDGQDPNVGASAKKNKEEKKIEPEVSTVKKVEETKQINPIKKEASTVKATSAKEEKKTEEVTGIKAEKAQNEGKLPENPANVEKPAEEIQMLAEEKVLVDGITDENVAKDISSKYPGSRIVTDELNGKKQFIIMVKESKTDKKEICKVCKKEVDSCICEAKNEEKKCSCSKEGCSNCKESTTVSIDTEEKKVVATVNDDGSVNVNTTDNVVTPEVNTELQHTEHEASETPSEEELEYELNPEEEAEETVMAEKIYVSELLKVKKTLTEREQSFIKEVDSFNLDEAKKSRVINKLKALKSKKAITKKTVKK